MQFELTPSTVRAMADRLQKSTPALKRSQAYEAVAQMLGHPNWDTLSGLLKREERDAAGTQQLHRLVTPVTLYVGAFSTSEFGDGADWAKVTVDQEFLDTVLRLQQTCKDSGLDHTAIGFTPDYWQEDDTDPLRIQDEDLYVGKRSWWFRGVPKHCSYAVETRAVDIEDLLQALFARKETSYLAWRKDVLVYDSAGDINGLLAALVDAGELHEDYLPG